MNLYFTLASYAVAAALGFGTAWQMQDATITKIHLEAAHELIQQQADARDDAERAIAQVRAAQDKSAVRLRTVSAERTVADAAGHGLRITTAEAVRASTQDSTACAIHARALGVVFDACSKELIDVSGKADEWVAEALMQHEAAK